MIIEVLNLGPSIKNYIPNSNTTIGVNDIFKYHPVDYLVLVDPPNRFTEPDRLEIILKSTPKKFLSNRDWDVPNFEKIELLSPRSFVDLDSNKYSYSNTSTFVACILAYKLGAKKIILHGADFTSHKLLSHKNNLERILKDFTSLQIELKKKHVALVVSCPHSLLAQILPLI